MSRKWEFQRIYFDVHRSPGFLSESHVDVDDVHPKTMFALWVRTSKNQLYLHLRVGRRVPSRPHRTVVSCCLPAKTWQEDASSVKCHNRARSGYQYGIQRASQRRSVTKRARKHTKDSANESCQFRSTPNIDIVVIRA